eukprot:4437406-Alexandrium_andersonii.AAC.1
MSDREEGIRRLEACPDVPAPVLDRLRGKWNRQDAAMALIKASFDEHFDHGKAETVESWTRGQLLAAADRGYIKRVPCWEAHCGLCIARHKEIYDDVKRFAKHMANVTSDRPGVAVRPVRRGPGQAARPGAARLPDSTVAGAVGAAIE